VQTTLLNEHLVILIIVNETNIVFNSGHTILFIKQPNIDIESCTSISHGHKITLIIVVKYIYKF